LFWCPNGCLIKHF